MEIHQLRYFLALSQERNFSRAAKRAAISQPTLSQQIKKLEDELGTPLFERSAHGVRLTPSGEKFLPHALQALDQLERGVSEVQAKSGKITGRIRVAAIPTIGPYLLPGVLKKLKSKAPNLVLELFEETTSSLLEHLKEGVFDLGILALPIEDSGIVSRLLGKENFYLAVSKKHPLAQKKQVTLKNIAHEKLLILQEGHCFSDQSLEYCKRSREDPQIIFQGSSLISVMKFAEAEEGITLVPHMAKETSSHPNLRFIPFSGPKPSREIAVIWRVSAPLHQGHRLLIQILEETLKAKTS